MTSEGLRVLYLASQKERRDHAGVEVRHAQQLQVQREERQRTGRDSAHYSLQSAHTAVSALAPLKPISRKTNLATQLHTLLVCNAQRLRQIACEHLKGDARDCSPV